MSFEKVYFEPISLKFLNNFLVNFHRHSNKVQNHTFSFCCKNQKGKIIGVVSASRPISRHLDDGLTLEIRRLCVLENKKNLCSIMYSKIIQVAKILGYHKVITYTKNDELGFSLKSSNFKLDGETKSDSSLWNKRREQPQTKIISPKKLEGTKLRWIYEIKKEYKTIRINEEVENYD